MMMVGGQLNANNTDQSPSLSIGGSRDSEMKMVDSEEE